MNECFFSPFLMYLTSIFAQEFMAIASGTDGDDDDDDAFVGGDCANFSFIFTFSTTPISNECPSFSRFTSMVSICGDSARFSCFTSTASILLLFSEFPPPGCCVVRRTSSSQRSCYRTMVMPDEKENEDGKERCYWCRQVPAVWFTDLVVVIAAVVVVVVVAAVATAAATAEQNNKNTVRG